MKTKTAYFALLLGLATLNAHADWTLVNDKGEAFETPVVFTRADEAGTEFVYGGRLTTEAFKVSDGTTLYVHDCGDSDPVGDSITLKEAATDDPALRVRYAADNDFFKVTIRVKGDKKSIEAERVILPNNRLYIHGGPFNLQAGGWQTQDAVLLEQDKDNPSIFWYKGDIRYNNMGSEGGNLKILLGRGWGENYHPDASGDVPLLNALKKPMKMRLGGADNKWTVPADRTADGHYEIKIDMLNLTIEVVRFEADPQAETHPRAIFGVGTAFPCGYPQDNTTPIQMNAVSDGVYSWAGMLTEGEFKFQKKRGSYMYGYMALVNGTEIVPGQEYGIEYIESYFGQDHLDRKFVITATQAGMGEVSVDLNTMTMWLGERPEQTKAETPAGDAFTCYTRDGRLYLGSDTDADVTARIFGVDGRLVAERTFARTTDIALPAGSYIVALDGARVQAYVR